MTVRSLVVPSFCTDLFDRQSFCHNCLELNNAVHHLYFQMVHYVEEGEEVVVGAEAEKEQVVCLLTLVDYMSLKF